MKSTDIVKDCTRIAYLEPLGIKIEELPDENRTYYNKINILKDNPKTTFIRKSGNHAPEFYLEIDRKFIEFVLNYVKD